MVMCSMATIISLVWGTFNDDKTGKGKTSLIIYSNARGSEGSHHFYKKPVVYPHLPKKKAYLFV